MLTLSPVGRRGLPQVWLQVRVSRVCIEPRQRTRSEAPREFSARRREQAGSWRPRLEVEFHPRDDRLYALGLSEANARFARMEGWARCLPLEVFAPPGLPAERRRAGLRALAAAVPSLPTGCPTVAPPSWWRF